MTRSGRLYKRLFVAAMNHHLTPEFLERRLDYYRRAGRAARCHGHEIPPRVSDVSRTPAGVLLEVDGELAEHRRRASRWRSACRPTSRSRSTAKRRGTDSRDCTSRTSRSSFGRSGAGVRPLGGGRPIERDATVRFDFGLSVPRSWKRSIAESRVRGCAACVATRPRRRRPRHRLDRAYVGSRQRPARRRGISDAHARGHGRGLQRRSRRRVAVECRRSRRGTPRPIIRS